MIIYMATNRLDGKEYVGQTINNLKQRRNEHIGASLNKRDNNYFHSAIRKHGPENFDWEIIQECNSIDQLNRLEIFYIGYYDTFGNGYNLTNGGKNILASEETKKRISDAVKGQNNPFYGKTHSILSREKITEAGKNRGPVSDETRKKMSDAQRGENNANYGKTMSDAQKKKLSKAQKGKYMGKNNPKARKVLINNKYFNTRKEAAEFIGVAPSTIRVRILHKTKWSNYKYV